ncbi:hypothetical protein ACG2LH_05635 [Zhouia sp. PK063]|uniref:hypothetical protein n=1 Tax=Zhouia sp. PK063 TaxID=3373602 RepID=UPI003796117F
MITMVYWSAPYAGEVVFYYTFSTPLIICIINYQSLQKLYSFAIWFLIAIGQYVLYAYISECDQLNLRFGNAADGLQKIWIFLILHQLFRVIHVFLLKREYKPINLLFAGAQIFKGNPDYILNAPLALIFIVMWMICFYYK